MKHALAAVLAMVLFLIIMLGAFIAITPAAAETPRIPIPTVTVTLPVLPPITIKVPVPGPTKTITLPGTTLTLPGQTVTVTANPPGATATQTITEPAETETETVTAQPSEAPAETETVTESPSAPSTGQSGTTGATIEPDEEGTVLPEFINEPQEIVGYGILTILALVGLILLGLWGGYVLGYKDRQSTEARFLRALRDQLAVRNR